MSRAIAECVAEQIFRAFVPTARVIRCSTCPRRRMAGRHRRALTSRLAQSELGPEHQALFASCSPLNLLVLKSMRAISGPLENLKLVEFLIRGSAALKKNGNKLATLDRFARQRHAV